MSGYPWSAGCDESRTSGAEGGPEKRTGSNPGTALRSDPYIVGRWQRSAVATLVERKTRLTKLARLHLDHAAPTVGDALIAAFNVLPAAMRRTLTWDQGNEMFHHRRIEAATGIRVYFADPHSPWQRGSNENTNGLLRQYMPKGTDLSIWSQAELDAIASELNDRPRACLGDLTPTQAMRRLRHQATTHLIRDVR